MLPRRSRGPRRPDDVAGPDDLTRELDAVAGGQLAPVPYPIERLAGALPRLTAVVGPPGASTTELLAQLAGALGPTPLVVVDPKGDASALVARHADPAAVRASVTPRGPLPLHDVLMTVSSAPSGVVVLVDCADLLWSTDAERDQFAAYLRTLRMRKHRVVLGVHRPGDLPRLPRPEVWCVFPGAGYPDRAWAREAPEVSAAGAFARNPCWNGWLNCMVVSDRGEVYGVVEVGHEPQMPSR